MACGELADTRPVPWSGVDLLADSRSVPPVKNTAYEVSPRVKDTMARVIKKTGEETYHGTRIMVLGGKGGETGSTIGFDN